MNFETIFFFLFSSIVLTSAIFVIYSTTNLIQIYLKKIVLFFFKNSLGLSAFYIILNKLNFLFELHLSFLLIILVSVFLCFTLEIPLISASISIKNSNIFQVFLISFLLSFEFFFTILFFLIENEKFIEKIKIIFSLSFLIFILIKAFLISDFFSY
jgi:hypothetical protein